MLAAKILTLVVVLMTIVVPFAGYFFFGKKTRRSFIKTLAINICTFFAAIIISEVIIFTGTAHAAEAASQASIVTGIGYLSAALSVGISCVASAIAVSASSSAALGAISEDSSILGKSLIFVGLSEGIALYGLIISFMILGSL